MAGVTRTSWRLASAASVWAIAVLVGSGQTPITPSALRNHAAIRYQSETPHDLVARLNAQLRSGETALVFEPVTGYLRSVLGALHISVDSQLLVYSKTSFQAHRISPANPRALYFNDTVAVGWVRGGDVLEFAAHDPALGTVFYTLPQTPDGMPQAVRQLTCIQCHTWEATLDVPGLFVSSVVPASDGSVLSVPVFSVDHRTPFDQRWGGWFVSGTHDLPRHMGNTLVASGGTIEDSISPATTHVETLDGHFDPAGYPSMRSDVVALLVFEHQARMLNLMTRAGWEARVGADAGRPLSAIVDELVDYMLFVDERPLPGPAMPSAFARTFTAPGPFDARGRSLRDLDLRSRVFKYPCSYLIYSDSFDAMPDRARDAIYARLWAVLSGSVPGERYERLTAADRRAIVEILRDTKLGLPDYFDRDR